MSIREISLQECPAELREAVEKRLTEQQNPWELLSVTVFTYTPYIDKSVMLTNYEVILCKSNTFFLMDYTDDGNFRRLRESMFTLGTLKRIMEKAPEGMGLAFPQGGFHIVPSSRCRCA